MHPAPFPFGQILLMLALLIAAWVAIRSVGRRFRRALAVEGIVSPQAGDGLDEATVLRAAESLGIASMVDARQLATMTPREREVLLMTLVGKASAAKGAEHPQRAERTA
jgi:hypothetical protein